MKQALHIFLKDVRRLRVQIVLLVWAIGYFAVQDIHVPGVVNGSGALIVEFIVGAMVWFLIARAVHEESLSGDNQFWVTRPYQRASLAGAKLLMVVVAVIVPMFVADCVMLGAQSLAITENLGALILRQFVTAAWLVLPPMAIASVTRSITEDVMVWVASLAVAGLCYFPSTSVVTFQSGGEEYWFGAAVLLLVVVVWRQCSRRGTVISRILVAAAVLLPTLPFPASVAAEIDGMKNDPAAAAITIRVKSVTAAQEMGPYSHAECVSPQVELSGVRPEWRISVLAEKDTFTADTGKTVTIPWHSGGFLWNRLTLDLCAPANGMKAFRMGRNVAVHTSVILGVFANRVPVEVKATQDPLTLRGVGRCQFMRYYLDDSALLCKTPLRIPSQGEISITGESANSRVSMVEYAVTPMGLLPGMSPVYKWITLAANTQIQQAIAKGESIRFVPEKRIAVLERAIDVKNVEF